MRRLTWNQNFLVSPVELELMISSEGVHHGSYWWLRPLAHEVKVQHGLYSARLHAPHDGFGLGRDHVFTSAGWTNSSARASGGGRGGYWRGGGDRLAFCLEKMFRDVFIIILNQKVNPCSRFKKKKKKMVYKNFLRSPKNCPMSHKNGTVNA